MQIIANQEKGATHLLMGNEAIARGALEAGIDFIAAYPGNPSSEIMETLAHVSKRLGVYAEWSINEKVALEAAAAASFAGLRAMTSMKQNGVNVVSDFMTNLTLSGVKGGLILVSCDDPGGISSTNEEDARPFAKLAEVPLLEPSSPEEAREMTRFAFDLSEEIESLCMIRSTSRISHARGNVTFGVLPKRDRKPAIDPRQSINTFPIVAKHAAVIAKLAKASEIFENCPFNQYVGPESPELLVITSGTGFLYTLEMLTLLDLKERVGIAKLGTTWPLPEKWVLEQVQKSQNIVFVEEVAPFLEDNVKALCAQRVDQVGPRSFFGKASGHMPRVGELDPDLVGRAVTRILNLTIEPSEGAYTKEDLDRIVSLVPQRELGFCPGCPHRASFFSIKNALKWDDQNGFVSGDIGCYTMGIWPTGFSQVNSVHAMGSGVGLASGYGKLKSLGFEQPVMAVVGDSTFFHAGLTPLVNAVYNQSDFLLVVLDNSATAMTGFQPHPGTGVNAMGEVAAKIDIEAVCKGVGARVVVVDPFDLQKASQTLYTLLNDKGKVRVVIMRRKCALVQRKEGGFAYTVTIDADRCIGEACGCNRYCSRIFRCPGLIWDEKAGKSRIDPVICVGCGVCVQICPQGAIRKEEVTG